MGLSRDSISLGRKSSFGSGHNACRRGRAGLPSTRLKEGRIAQDTAQPIDESIAADSNNWCTTTPPLPSITQS